MNSRIALLATIIFTASTACSAMQETSEETESEPLGEAEDALASWYGCGSCVGYDDGVVCGTVFLGETDIWISNISDVDAVVWYSYLYAYLGVPAHSSVHFVRWFWGADQEMIVKTPGTYVCMSH